SVDDPSTVTAIEQPASGSRADSVHDAATAFARRPAIVRMIPPDRRRPETTIIEVRSQYEMCQREGELVRDCGEYLEALCLEWFVLELAVEDTKLQTDVYV